MKIYYIIILGEILITKEGNVIVGTSNGIDLYNEEKGEFEKLLYNNDKMTSLVIRTLTEDSNGNIWGGTSGGLNRFDKKPKKVLGTKQMMD